MEVQRFLELVEHLTGALGPMAPWGRLHRYDSLDAQHQTLVQKHCGHLAYDGITGNALALQAFRAAVLRIWRKWLSRRRRFGYLSWALFNRLLKRYPLPAVVVVHSVYRR